MAAGLTTLLLFSGLAVDSGRAYVVKSQLTKAVDGAALAAARNLNSGDPKAEAAKVFKANFPAGYLGTNGTDPTLAGDFYSSSVNAATGVNTVKVKASDDAAHHLHETRRHFVHADRQRGRGDAAHGRSVARDRRLELDRLAMGGRAGCGAHVRELVRCDQRPHVAHHVRQRRHRTRRHAVIARLQQDRS